MATPLKNIIVVGGSYVGRVLLIEPHSHFHHLFAFPRFAIVPGHEHKAFIPYTGIFSSVPRPSAHAVVQARVLSVSPQFVTLDRQWQDSKQIPYEYLAIATGTRLAEPAGMKSDDKVSSVQYLRNHQADIQRAKSILIVGGGAVGVQMATDLREYYPDKDVTLVQSRARVMPLFHEQLHELIKKRFDELGVRLIVGARASVPPEGFPTNGKPFDVELTNGSKVSTEFVILATGQRPNNDLLTSLTSSSSGSLINPDNGFIRVRPTLQLQDERFSNIFAVGDIADTGAQKAARPGSVQAGVVARNIQALIEGRRAEEEYVPPPAAIHLTLGMKSNVIFRNPNTAEGQTEPWINEKTEMVASTIHLLCTAFALTAEGAALQLPLFGASEPQIPVAGKELISSSALQSQIDVGKLLNRAKHLYSIAELGSDEYNHPTRVIGSKGHLGTLDYIYATLTEFDDYYTISNQTFPAVTGNVMESRLVLGHTVPESALPMGLTPPTKNHEPVYGPLVLVSRLGCEAADYPPELQGAIAFISRGSCPFGTKSALAGKAGAVAAVIFNNEKGGLGGTLGTPSPDHVATFGLSDSDAAPFLEQLRRGQKVDAIAYMDATVETITTTNIIAQTKEGDADNCVMAGAHSDSVMEGPGINDDGSGSLTLLEIASLLPHYRVNNCVRLAWWAGEEEGLLGSDYYVSVLSEAENLKIRLFMDYDMLASPNFAYQVYNATNAVNPVGSEQLRDLYTEFYEAHGLNFTYIPFDGRSDYDAFIRNGIPGGGIATGAEVIKTEEEQKMFGGVAGDAFDPCYHQLCDDVSNVNLTAWEVNTKLVAHSIATYARSFDGFPKRIKVESMKKGDEQRKYHGHSLLY
ncbi:aminopeptidase [Aspergillus fumigatus Z5]|nr:aminopeptidase [Aspergillus fumigatus Z5]